MGEVLRTEVSIKLISTNLHDATYGTLVGKVSWRDRSCMKEKIKKKVKDKIVCQLTHDVHSLDISCLVILRFTIPFQSPFKNLSSDLGAAPDLSVPTVKVT